ncbi:SRPBCC family protein [Streptomyces sp. NPDC055078]
MNHHPDTLTTTADGRTALRMERRLAHPPQRVWDAITRPEQLARWFPSEVSVELRPGGKVGFLFPGETEPDLTGVVTDAEEPRLFGFTWGDDHLRWEIVPDGEGSLLTLVHTFGDRFGAASFASGWHGCVTALGQFLDGVEISAMRDTSGRLHESYIEQFGLGRGIVETTPEGWCIRFERQLVRPAQLVWADLTGTATPLLGGPAPKGFAIPEAPPGPITALRPPNLLAYNRPDGEVRWHLTEGTGHGPRLTLTHTGPRTTDPRAPLLAWETHIGQLALRLGEL